MKPKSPFLILLILTASSSCATIRDGHVCAVNSALSAGGICVHLVNHTDKYVELSSTEMLDLLEAHPSRNCVPVSDLSVCSDSQIGNKVDLPARGPGIVMSAEDWNMLKSELEKTCRDLGSRCSYETSQTLKSPE